jgi:ADP-ribose pyrophosphatase
MERGNAIAVLGHDPKRDEVVLANEFRPGALAAGDYPYRDNLVAGEIEMERLRWRLRYGKCKRRQASI